MKLQSSCRKHPVVLHWQYLKRTRNLNYSEREIVMNLSELKKGVEDFHGDTSRSIEDAIREFEDLKDDIQCRIEALEEDLANQE